jgi:mannose-6-phosphate isomerase-like protein (cupin superfamily)
MRILFAIALLLATITFAATLPQNKNTFGLWRSSELRELETKLHEQVAGPRKNAHIDLADYGASAVTISRREGNGIGESHAEKDDYFIVQSGSGVLITGGSIVKAMESEPGESRGEGIHGGERRTLRPGDIVHIPARMPHQLLVEPGTNFTYVIINVRVAP